MTLTPPEAGILAVATAATAPGILLIVAVLIADSTVSAIETGRRGIAIEEADALATLLHDSPYRGVFLGNIQDLVRRIGRHLDQCRESLTTTFDRLADVIHDTHTGPRPEPDPPPSRPVAFVFPDYLDAPKGRQ